MYSFKELRKNHNLSQQQMADRLGLNSQAYVSNIESGERNVSAQLAYTIMQEFDVVAHVVMATGEWSFTPQDQWGQP